MRIWVTCFNSIASRKGVVSELDLEEFRTPVVVAEKLSAPAFSPALFYEGGRREDIEGAHSLVFDFDGDKRKGMLDVDIDELLKNLLALRCAAVVHNTWSNARKFRIILPTSRRITAKEYKLLHSSVAKKLGSDDLDITSNQIQRLFFVPSVHPDRQEEFSVEIIEGPALDVDNIKQDFFEGVQVGGHSITPETYYELLLSAKSKNEELNRCTFVLASESALSLEQFTEQWWPIAQQALRDNTVSEPVKSWSAARNTFDRAAKAAKDKAAAQLTERETAVLSHRLGLTGQTLTKWTRAVQRNPETLQDAAKALVLQPRAETTAALVTALQKSGQLDVPAMQTSVQAAFAAAQAEVDEKLAELRSKPSPDWSSLELELDQHGLPALNDYNVLRCLQELCQGIVKDARTQQVLHLSPAPWHDESDSGAYPRTLNIDSETAGVQMWIKEIFGRAVAANHIRTGLRNYAESRPATYDKFVQYLDALTWDGTPRLDTWLVDLCGAADTPLTRAFGRKWLISAVQRNYRPGSKADTALILVGNQGVGKSSTLAALVPDNSMFADNLPALHDKDVHLRMSELVIVELAELHQLTNQTQAELVKAFLTTTQGYVRQAYAASAQMFLRRAVIAGSTNEMSGFLTDVTGGRRFWPVEVTRCDVPAVTAARDQLWAEAVAAWRKGEVCWLSKDEESQAEEMRNQQHSVTDERVLLIQQFLDGSWPKHSLRPWSMENLYIEEQVVRVFSDQFDEHGVPKFITPTQVCEILATDINKLSLRKINHLLTKAGCRKAHDMYTVDTRRACLWTKVL